MQGQSPGRCSGAEPPSAQQLSYQRQAKHFTSNTVAHDHLVRLGHMYKRIAAPLPSSSGQQASWLPEHRPRPGSVAADMCLWLPKRHTSPQIRCVIQKLLVHASSKDAQQCCVWAQRNHPTCCPCGTYSWLTSLVLKHTSKQHQGGCNISVLCGMPQASATQSSRVKAMLPPATRGHQHIQWCAQPVGVCRQPKNVQCWPTCLSVCLSIWCLACTLILQAAIHST